MFPLKIFSAPTTVRPATVRPAGSGPQRSLSTRPSEHTVVSVATAAAAAAAAVSSTVAGFMAAIAGSLIPSGGGRRIGPAGHGLLGAGAGAVPGHRRSLGFRQLPTRDARAIHRRAAAAGPPGGDGRQRPGVPAGMAGGGDGGGADGFRVQ